MMYSGDRWGDYDSDYVVGASVFGSGPSDHHQPLVANGMPTLAMTAVSGSPLHEPSAHILSLDDNPPLETRSHLRSQHGQLDHSGLTLDSSVLGDPCGTAANSGPLGPTTGGYHSSSSSAIYYCDTSYPRFFPPSASDVFAGYGNPLSGLGGLDTLSGSSRLSLEPPDLLGHLSLGRGRENEVTTNISVTSSQHSSPALPADSAISPLSGASGDKGLVTAGRPAPNGPPSWAPRVARQLPGRHQRLGQQPVRDGQ
ncbi:hypothetical protein HDE_05509 [Halotydeus destructor]|nr:hypothetical protein HDE_05509 [Halotydeus destructor]